MRPAAFLSTGPARRLCVGLTALAVVAALAGGCGRLLAPEIRRPVLSRQPDPSYETLFPYYAELCALSQWRPVDGGSGGIPGHAVMYLKGVCRKPGAPHPTLEWCDPATDDPDDPRHGVGLSVNRLFRNVNFVAIPGRRLFVEGNLAPEDRLTRERREAVVERVVDLGLYRGIEAETDDGVHHAPSPETERLLARDGVGTDFALRFARTIFCARLPLTRPMMESVMGYLNARNAEYAANPSGFRWSGFYNNCVHLVYNALAAAGVWPRKSTNQNLVAQVFNIAVPANAVIDLAELATRPPPAHFSDIWLNPLHLRSLLEAHWLPMRHGALVTTLPIHAENDLYDTRVRILLFQPLLLRPQSRTAERLLGDIRFIDLSTNLLHFELLYQRLLNDRETGGWYTPSYGRAREAYHAYLEEQLADVRRLLARLTPRELSGPVSPSSVREAQRDR